MISVQTLNKHKEVIEYIQQNFNAYFIERALLPPHLPSLLDTSCYAKGFPVCGKPTHLECPFCLECMRNDADAMIV